MLKTSSRIADEVIYELVKNAAPPAAPIPGGRAVPPAMTPQQANPGGFPGANIPAGHAAGTTNIAATAARPHQTGPTPQQAAILKKRGF